MTEPGRVELGDLRLVAPLPQSIGPPFGGMGLERVDLAGVRPDQIAGGVLAGTDLDEGPADRTLVEGVAATHHVEHPLLREAEPQFLSFITTQATPTTRETIMTLTRSLIASFGLTAALLVGGAGCAKDSATNAALKSAGVDADVATDGGLPDGFPEAVATPDLDLETGAGIAGVFTLRYTSKDSATDVGEYRATLKEKGFAIDEEFTFDKTQGDYVGFMASSPEFTVMASAYGEAAPGGGNYMAVVVTPV